MFANIHIKFLLFQHLKSSVCDWMQTELLQRYKLSQLNLSIRIVACTQGISLASWSCRCSFRATTIFLSWKVRRQRCGISALCFWMPSPFICEPRTACIASSSSASSFLWNWRKSSIGLLVYYYIWVLVNIYKNNYTKYINTYYWQHVSKFRNIVSVNRSKTNII